MTGAQRRHPRAGTGTGWRSPYYGGSHGGYYGGGYHGGGYYHGRYYGGYYPYYRPYYWGYGYYPWSGLYFDSYWGDGYYGGGYYGGGYYDHDAYADSGEVRVLVDQHHANVYVDGYYAGIVDDFDGIFQHLDVAPGRHAITVKLDGYQTHTFDAFVPPDGTLKLHWDMVKGSGDDGTGDPTKNVAVRRDSRDQGYRDVRAERDSDDRDDDSDRYTPSDENRWPRGADQGDREAPPAARDAAGTLRLIVQPDDASVYVDGAFRGTAEELRKLDLPAGSHRIEIVRPGYRTLERDVKIDSTESLDLNVKLDR